MGDGVFDKNFWSSVRQYVIDAGVEALTLGETQEKIWGKILQAMIANGVNVSIGSSRADVIRLLTASISGGGYGPIFPLAKGALGVFEGDSLTARTDGCSIAGWLSIVSGGRVNYPPLLLGGTVGNGGERTDHILAQADGNIAAMPGLKYIIIHVGTNDLQFGASLATMMSNITQAIDKYNAAGIHVIFSCILPRGDSVGITLNQQRLDFNAGVAALTGRRLTVVNHDATMPQSDATLYNQSDLLHATVKGTRQMATNIYAAMSFVTTSVTEELPTNALTNPTLSGTAGSITGGFVGGSVCPDSWRIQNDTGATITASIVTESGARKIQFDISGSCSNASANLFFRQSTTPFSLLIGEWMEGEMNVEITGPGGVGPIVGLDGWAVRGGLGYIFDQNHGGTALYGAMTEVVNAPARLLPLKETANNTPLFLFYAQFAVGAVSGQIKISAPHAGKYGT